MRGNAQDEGHGHHGGHLTLANDRTIDEAPGAYKPIEDIIGPLHPFYISIPLS